MLVTVAIYFNFEVKQCIFENAEVKISSVSVSIAVITPSYDVGNVGHKS